MRRVVLNHKLVLAMALWMAVISIPPSNAFAYPSESLLAVGPASVREAQITQIMGVLSRPEAQLHLRLMGIGNGDVKDALSKLDDVQLAQLAQKSDAVKAGGDALGVVVAILVIVLLIVVIASLMDKRIKVEDAKK